MLYEKGHGRRAKKRVSSAGWHPAERANGAGDGSAPAASRSKKSRAHVFSYQDSNPRRTRLPDSLYCYLCSDGFVNDRAIRAFIDSGASFNAISPKLAAMLKLKIDRCDKPLHVTLGHNQRIVVPRLVSNITIRVDGFSDFSTEVFVMPIPEDLDVLLGIPWLDSVNPDIDWQSKTIRPRDSTVSHQFRQCVPVAPSVWKGGRRCRASPRVTSMVSSSHDDLMLFYSKHALVSAHGETKVVPARRLKRLLRERDNEFCFVLNVNDPSLNQKAERQLTQSWEALASNPAFRVARKYKDTVFRDELPSTPPVRPSDLEAEIELTDDTPVARKPIRLSAEMRDALRAWTAQMLKAGVIRKSTSPYCAPTFCVKKPVGWRIVHDFRGLNTKIRIPATPIPRKDDIFDAMSRGRLFSSMDLLWGFYQVRLRESDIPYTAFATPDGLYEYLVTPMGLSSSPASFNRMIQHIFKDLSSICQAYFDDLFVFTDSDDVETHLAALDRVLARCEEKQLYIKLSKCVFCAPEIPCLGDYFGRDGIRMDPDKVRAISEWVLPRTKRDMMSFIGTCVYVLKFCPDFAELSAPLTAAIQGKSRNERIDLSPEAVDAFTELKRRLASPPVLGHPDFSEPFHVRMDASDYAVGGYLFQMKPDGTERIIAYGGRKMKREELAYPTREKELLAALHAMRTWKVYLIDRPFYINTDHRTLESILSQTTCSQRLARWLDELCMFRPLFTWIAGETNTVADAISRAPQWQPAAGAHHVSLADLIARLQVTPPDDPEQVFLNYARVRPSIHDSCRQLYDSDPTFGPVYARLQPDVLPPPTTNKLVLQLGKFTLDNGLLLYRVTPDAPPRLCVPTSDDLRNRILYEEHDTATRGHPGVVGTLAFLRSKYFWPHMEKSVRKYVRSCELCQRVKHSQLKPAGLLHPLEIPSGRWRHIAMDFMVKLPVTRNGHDQIMVLVDRLTKRAHFVPVRLNASAPDIAVLFRDWYQRLHGLPSSIVSDRDSKFTSRFWQALMALQHTELRMSSAFKPSTDGQAERTNQFIIAYLRSFINPHHDDWDEHLALAEFAYNSRTHSSINMSPFMADLGYNPRSAADLAIMPLAVPHAGATTFHRRQADLLRACQDAMAAAQRSMKSSFDRHRPDVTFAANDQVLLDTQNLALHHVGTDGKRKFAPRYIGPYSIVAMTSPNTYKLRLPPGLQLHDEFHVSYLRRYVADENPHRVNHVPRLLTRDGSEGVQVRAIIGHRTRRNVLQYRVEWFDKSRPSWEPASTLVQAAGLIEQYHARLTPPPASPTPTVPDDAAPPTRPRRSTRIAHRRA